MSRRSACLLLLFAAGVTPVKAQTGSAPASPPQTPRYARSRDYHLSHISLHLVLDWPHRSFSGTATETVIPLREGLEELEFDAGPGVQVTGCTVDGTASRFAHEGDQLRVSLAAPAPRGRPEVMEIAYTCHPAATRRGPFQDPGWHWIEPDRSDPSRRPGFYTQGWPEANHQWVPLYDYPNDKCTSDVTVEVPASWYVVGNGALVRNSKGSGDTRIFQWRMVHPHSTYLLSLAGGEMDVREQRLGAHRLLFAVPRGEGALIAPSFSHTEDMVRFYEGLLSVPYPWAKYAQTAVFDFGGGMENVSASTLMEGALADARSGDHPMDRLDAHELAHQWFGDMVTYRDWSEAWLSEGFATFMEELYREHSRGKDAYDRARDAALRAYLQESRRRKRPIVSRLYANAGQMLDRHTYEKGALVLHMLRRTLGDTHLFQALGAYLKQHAYGLVTTADLVESLEDTTGRPLGAFFEQWVYHPGHPMVEYSWSYDAAAHQVVISLKQVQSTADGTPVFAMDVPFALVTGGRANYVVRHVERASEEIRLPADTRPDAVLLDPDHELLLERRPYAWLPGEAEAVLRFAPCSLDRQAAALELLKPEANAETALRVMSTVERDSSPAMIAEVLRAITPQKRAALRPTYRTLMRHRDDAVEAAAMIALGSLSPEPEDVAELRGRVNDREPYAIVTAALAALGQIDADGNLDLFRRAEHMASRHEVIAAAALFAAAHGRLEAALGFVMAGLELSRPRPVREAAASALGSSSPGSARATGALIALLQDADPQVRDRAIAALGARKDPAAVPALRSLAQATADPAVRTAASRAVETLEGKPQGQDSGAQ